jgi:hypothetical protein
VIEIPSSVEIIGERVLWGCYSLEKIIFESGSKLKAIKQKAFIECAVKTIRFPSSLEFIGNECFSECKFLHEVLFESDSRLCYIGEKAFKDCLVQTFEISGNVHYIGDKSKLSHDESSQLMGNCE